MSVARHALKRATDDMLAALGGQTKAAPFTRVGQSTLSTYASVHNRDAFAPIDIIADLEPLTRDSEGFPFVTQALCAVMGGCSCRCPMSPPAMRTC